MLLGNTPLNSFQNRFHKSQLNIIIYITRIQDIQTFPTTNIYLSKKFPLFSKLSIYNSYKNLEREYDFNAQQQKKELITS